VGAVLAAVLATGCADGTGPNPFTSLSGTYIADSIFVWTSWDTGADAPSGVALTLVLRPDSTIGGRLAIPAFWMPDGLPAVDDTLTGNWDVIPGGFRVYGPFGSLLNRADFTVSGDTARTRMIVRDFPLDPFSYAFRLRRQ
jgi:hypothetical protein